MRSGRIYQAYFYKVSINIFLGGAGQKLNGHSPPQPQPGFFKNVKVDIAHLQYKILCITNRLRLLAGERGSWVAHWWPGRFFLSTVTCSNEPFPRDLPSKNIKVQCTGQRRLTLQLSTDPEGLEEMSLSWKRGGCMAQCASWYSVGTRVAASILRVKELVVVFGVKDLAFEATLYLWFFNNFWACIICKEK